MYHVRLNGSHYEMGFKWGKRLSENGVSILSNIPFPISDDRICFSHACEEHYKRYFPEIIDEIHGIADGQRCSYAQLTAVLFSMYCLIPSTNCSCFAVRTKDNSVIMGRNSDFLTKIEKLYMNTIYKFNTGSYSFNGNTTAFVEMEDGVNEHKLAIGLTSVAPYKIKPGLNAGMLLRMGLEKCRTVDDFVNILKHVPIASSQTFVVADAQNNGALVECSSMDIEIVPLVDDVNFVFSTNMFNTDKMKKYNNLPDDTWQAEERYKVMRLYLEETLEGFDVKRAKSLLSGEQGFLCQYDRKTGKDTVWSVIYDVSRNSIYRVEGNPSRKKFKEDKRFFKD